MGIYFAQEEMMMRVIIMCITFHPMQNNYSATRLKCQNFNQKVQADDEIKRVICKYQV